MDADTINFYSHGSRGNHKLIIILSAGLSESSSSHIITKSSTYIGCQRQTRCFLQPAASSDKTKRTMAGRGRRWPMA